MCRELFEDPSDWNITDAKVLQEVDELLSSREWFRVYDFAELFHAKLRVPPPGRTRTSLTSTREFAKVRAEGFEARLNRFFMEQGIGWKMSGGKIVHRGSDAFERATQRAVEALENSERQTAKREIEEAFRDISRRPEPDVTGAITHAMIALECVAREVTGKPNATLGKLVPGLNLTAPLDKAIHALWGFSSERARHMREGQAVSTDEAELVVLVACALCTFLSGKTR